MNRSAPPLLRVRNWDKWQTYRKDRPAPGWIKVYRRLLLDPDFVMLSDAEKWHVIGIWMVAADRNGCIPYDSLVVQKLIGSDVQPDLERLLELQILESPRKRRQPNGNQSATKRQPSGNRAVALEERREEKTPPLGSPPGETSPPRCPMGKIRELWIRHIGQEITSVDRWHENRKRAVQALWRNGKLGADLEEWEGCFKYIAASKFLMGDNSRGWRADFDWALKPANLTKLEEGKYHR